VSLAGFSGRRFDVEVASRRLVGTLRRTRLDRRDDDYTAELELADVGGDGPRFERLRVVAGSVAVSAPPNVTLTASDIQVDGPRRW